MACGDNNSGKLEAGSLSLQQQMLTFEPQLRAYAMSLSRSADRSDDLVQETLMRAISKIHTFRPGTNLGAWLTTILRNCYLSDLRRRRHEVEDADGCYSESLRAAPEQEGLLEYKEFCAALREIPFDQREALMLVGAAGLSYEDTATLCRTTTGTIKSRINRARSRLAALLGIDNISEIGFDSRVRAVMAVHQAAGATRRLA
ncbi:sigma-70 family RNA polymerase sigma factor [Bosea sp. SSUT16]|jgi:RNA polymerase sigma-70 factor (ECF subfamily)|uniref:RNA polymerase sigma factor n=2 Tax=Bosea TaxID=85413 RepID=A0A927ECN4_9HYPH|nr:MULTISPECIES: sigma-70 family RNA polymerase sigma factor [Bosea]MBD3848379.1 sigma-70 family RNA polymerase sigma factor [Bosea spartocytisi]MCT4472727.1 sigma-70 family RNA polymerase sigma factor [Bosea spartocytisi]